MGSSFLNEEAALGEAHLGEISLQEPTSYQHLGWGTMGKEEATDILCGPGLWLTTGLLCPHNIQTADETPRLRERQQPLQGP